MSFHCQRAPKIVFKCGNGFNIRNYVVPSCSRKKLLPEFKCFSSSSNNMNASTALKTQQGLSTTHSFFPPSVYMTTTQICELRRKNTSIPYLESQSSCSSPSVDTFNHSQNIFKTSHYDNRSTGLSLNFPKPMLSKCSSIGLCSWLLSCNMGDQLCVGGRRELHSSAPSRDIYIIENEEEFESKVMDSKLPVVINFHADWCEPCHALKPLLESLAEKHHGKMHLAEVKVDDHVALLHTFEVTAVPAVLGVVKGQVTEKFVGLISETEVRAFVNTMIGE